MATKLAERKKVIQGIQKELWRRMDELGFTDVAQFVRSSGLEDKVSFETIRRALNDKNKPPSPVSVGVIMSRLGFANDRIREVMQLLGDDYMYLMIPPGATESAPWVEGLTGAAQELAAHDERNILYISNALRLVAEMGGVDVSLHLARMVPKARTYERQRQEPAAQSDEEGKESKGETEPGKNVKGKTRKLHL